MQMIENNLTQIIEVRISKGLKRKREDDDIVPKQQPPPKKITTAFVASILGNLFSSTVNYKPPKKDEHHELKERLASEQMTSSKANALQAQLDERTPELPSFTSVASSKAEEVNQGIIFYNEIVKMNPTTATMNEFLRKYDAILAFQFDGNNQQGRQVANHVKSQLRNVNHRWRRSVVATQLF